MAHEPVSRRSRWSHMFGRGNSSPKKPDAPPPVLLTSDQAAVAILVAIAVALITASWLASGGLSGGLVNFDAAEPLQAKSRTDINSADWTELAQLPEIGEALAKRIVAWRERHGRFASLEDLDRVPGIGAKTLDRLRPYLRPID
jgi:competence protein ComEA